jgi:hypothetical protein
VLKQIRLRRTCKLATSRGRDLHEGHAAAYQVADLLVFEHLNELLKDEHVQLCVHVYTVYVWHAMEVPWHAAIDVAYVTLCAVFDASPVKYCKCP